MKDSPSNGFIQILKECEPLLLEMGFKPYSFLEKGYAYYIEYKSVNTGSIVEFFYGPSEYHTGMIFSTSKGKFEMKDLFEIPLIVKWANDNKNLYENETKIKGELLYFIELLKVALPIFE